MRLWNYFFEDFPPRIHHKWACTVCHEHVSEGKTQGSHIEWSVMAFSRLCVCRKEQEGSPGFLEFT